MHSARCVEEPIAHDRSFLGRLNVQCGGQQPGAHRTRRLVVEERGQHQVAHRRVQLVAGIVASPVDGTTRVITMEAGMSMPEEIVCCDDTIRRFQYRITVPIFKHHRGTIDVIDLGDDTCLVVYSTEADPRTMALVIGGGTAGALDELKRQMESVMHDTSTGGTH